MPLVAIAAFFFVIGIMGTRPLVPLYALTLEIGPGEIGVLVAVHSLLPLLLALPFGKWMDTRGTRTALLVSVLVSAAGLMIPALLPDRTGLYLSQTVTGIGWAAFILAAQKNIGGMENDSWSRERNVATFSLGVAIGSLFGPLIGGFLAEFAGYIVALAGLGAAIVIALPIMIPLRDDRPDTAAPVPTPSSRNPLKILGYHRYLGRALLISALILMAKDMYVAYFPLYAYAIGLSASWVGIIIAIHNGGGVIMRFFLLPLVRAFGKNRVVVSSVLFSGLFFFAIPLTENLAVLTLVSLIIGLGLGLGQPLSITTTINLSPPDKVGEVLGFRLSWNRLTQVLTPLSFGGVAVLSGVSGVFLLVGLVLAVGSFRLWIPADAEAAGARERR